jgi:hypothetical protein
MDGPVVQAARDALEGEDVDIVLPYVHEPGESEVRAAFELASKARVQGAEAREVADRYFFETVVRVHRTGEGAPFTGLKPAGLDVGPVIPLAQEAIDSGDPTGLTELLAGAVRDEVAARLTGVLDAKADATEGVAAARRHVSARLGLQVWSHKLFGAIHAAPHEATGHGRG